ncbi:amino acid permease [Segniliparus rugosus]|uniref:GABA permease n=1 Tax=Segniliparus rugosus (strain ATCC BAA-974 / DSM 45345 / CCUG 50838 / CIP 108380 / JCM 13579 / CDC 945) TaxID=679197 RepID=E5XRM9_SEGRC|nr:amino acid permease [Segniliparus rugosus]EFV12992.1 GABA permease [Segniliparus rugosus ATCC BAA-974]
MAELDTSETGSDTGLRPGLRQRHLSMIAIGGVIGAGLFVGSGKTVHDVGPGVLLSYALAGLVVVLVMRMLGEMSAASPETGSFSAYADRAIGRWAGFSVGWLYAAFWILVLPVEAVAGALTINRWVGWDDSKQWIWALALMTALTVANVLSVRNYGEFEFWFASIKVVAITLFLAVGVLAVAGLIPGLRAPGTSNLLGHGGLFPHGPLAVLGAVPVVAFSFIGAEIATIAAGESQDPANAVRKAVNSVVWRVLVFYVGSLAIVVTLLPWDDASVKESPYVAVMKLYDAGSAATIMDVIVLTAVLSCLNSSLYTASRMLFSLSERGDAPKFLSRLNGAGSPRNAVLAATVVGFAAVACSYKWKDGVFSFLIESTGGIALLIWLVIAVSQLRMRKTFERDGVLLPVRMWGYPHLTVAAIAGIVVLYLGFGLERATRPKFLLTTAIAVVVVAWGLARDACARRRAAQTTAG